MKKLTCIGLAGLLCLSLAACGGGSDTPATSGGAASSGEAGGSGEAVTLEVWTWDMDYLYLDDIRHDFEAANPGVKISMEEMGTTQIYDKMTTSLASGTGLPDLLTLEGEQIAKFGTKFPDGLLELSDIVTPSDFLPVKMAEVTVDGKILACPWDSAPAALFYRKDIFEQAGVSPEDIRTWDDYIAAGTTILEETGVKMLPMSTSRSDIVFRMLMNQANGFYFDADGNSDINSDAAKVAMTQVKKMFDAGLTLEYGSWDEYVISMKEGTVATVPEAVWIIGSFKEEAPDTQGLWGVMEFPYLGEGMDGVATNGGSALAIPASTDYPDQAKAFLSYAMMDVDAQLKSYEQYGLFPSYLPVFDADGFTTTDDFFGGESIYDMFGELGQRIPTMNYTPNFEEAIEMSRNAMARILLDGADVDSTMDELQDQYVAKFGK